MKKYIEKSAKTVDEAIKLALEELGLDSKNDAEIIIVEEGSRGIFGLGAKNALVKVAPNLDLEGRAREFLDNVFVAMGLRVDMEFKTEGKIMKIDLIGDNMGIIIGKRGDTLDALEHLVNLSVNKGDGEYVKVVLDTENYRARREQTLIKLAKSLANSATKNNRKITLEPMSSNERRIIHATLQSNADIETFSIGDEPNRKVVISPKKK